MVANQTEGFMFEQTSVIKLLEAENCKPCKIYKKIFTNVLLALQAEVNWFGLVSLFNGISTLVGYLMRKLSLLMNSYDTRVAMSISYDDSHCTTGA